MRKFILAAALAVAVIGFGGLKASTTHGLTATPTLSVALTVTSQATDQIVTQASEVPRAAQAVQTAVPGSTIKGKTFDHQTATVAILNALLITGAIMMSASALDYLKRAFASSALYDVTSGPMRLKLRSSATTFDGVIDNVTKARRRNGRVATAPSFSTGSNTAFRQTRTALSSA